MHGTRGVSAVRVIDGELIAAFVASPDGKSWRGAIFAMHEGLGPELVAVCEHRHDLMGDALDCAVADLAFARRVVELAERSRQGELAS
jgi:hypothetical protein